jgi:hypothetical protein
MRMMGIGTSPGYNLNMGPTNSLENHMATTICSDNSFPLPTSTQQKAQPASRFRILSGQTTRLPRGKSKGRKASVGWVVAASLLGFATSYLVGAEVSPLITWEKTQLPAGERISVASSARAIANAAPATFHEQFNLHPTSGDVEEPIATF